MDHRLETKLIKAYQKILSAKRVLLVTHFNPDGDGLSSVCALIDLLESLNKPFFALCANQPPSVFGFLPHLHKIKYFTAKPELSDKSIFDAAAFQSYDLVIILDCGSISRTMLDAEIAARTKEQYIIEIDHHPRVDKYSDLEIRQDHAAATAEVVYQFFRANKLTINKNIANCLLTGIITDTANFLYPSTSELTVQIASEMLALGARLPSIMDNVLRNKSLVAMQLWGKVMANLKINRKFNIAVTALTNEEIREGEADKEEMDGISGFLSNLSGVRAVLFLREEKPGQLRGNLRTARNDVDVSKLAAIFGGGGHSKASGFRTEGKLVKTEKGWKVL